MARILPVLLGLFALLSSQSAPVSQRPAPITPLAAQSPFDSAYTPQDVETAYNYSPLYAQNITGAGQMVALIEFDGYNPTDLTQFDHEYGLVAASVKTHTVDGPFRVPVIDETTLDVEWFHALAPGAAIQIYYINPKDTASQSWKPMAQAVTRAMVRGAGIVSISLGSCGPDHKSSVLTAALKQAAASGVSIFVSSGDSGDHPGLKRDCGKKIGVSYPGGDPNVVSVGGTSLRLNNDGSIASEIGWAGSGGGKTTFLRPVWQVGSTLPAGSKRWAPDVSFLGDPNTGVSFYLKGRFHQAGGTSLGAPCWAAAWALIRQQATQAGKTIPIAPTALYQVANSPAYSQSFHDITIGSNGRYTAGPGWDPVTGWGTPNVAQLAQAVQSLSS